VQDFFQSVDVAYAAPAIDPDQPAEQKQLSSVEILEAPYPNSQDLRYALPLLQGVVLVAAAGYVIVNLAVDVAYSLLNPRIRVAGRRA